MTRTFKCLSLIVGLVLQMQFSSPACGRDEYWPFHQPQDASLWERALGPQEKDASFIINDIPIDYRPRNYRHAEHLLQMALYKTRTTNDPRLPDCLTNLGILFYRMGDFSARKRAVDLLSEALDLRKGKADALELAARQDWLAQAYRGIRLRKDLNTFTTAEHIYEHSLDIRKQTLGPQHYDTAACYQRIANVQHDQLNDSKAKASHEQARSIVADKAFVDCASGPPRPMPTSILGNTDDTLPEMIAFAQSILGQPQGPGQSPGRIFLATVVGTLRIPMDATEENVTRSRSTQEPTAAGSTENVTRTKTETLSDKEGFRVFLCPGSFDTTARATLTAYTNQYGLPPSGRTSVLIQARHLLGTLGEVAQSQDEAPQEIRTDRQGEYQIPDVEQGSYCLFGQLANRQTAIYWIYPFTVKQHETITFDFDTKDDAHVIWQSGVASR